MKHRSSVKGTRWKRPYVLLTAGKMTAALISLLARDMYEGTSAAGPLPSWEAFRADACLYHEVKRGLRDGTMDGHILDEDTFFRMKKCIFHWCEGIQLTLQCAGLCEEQSKVVAAEECDFFLRSDEPIPGVLYEAAKNQYESLVSGRVREQYGKREEIPSDDWCAWLELSAVKIMCLMIREQMKELHHGEK